VLEKAPGQRVGARGKVTPDRAQPAAGGRMLDRETVLQPAEPGAVEVQLVVAQAGGLADQQSL
jgi:hypothetical protein